MVVSAVIFAVTTARSNQGMCGVCQVRQNLDGTLYTLVYGSAISQQVDPIEKKPLYHFLPGSKAFSVATVGCNMQCQWCQNWQIAQAPRGSGWRNVPHTSPKELVQNALISGSQSIAYTYTEPTIFFEYAVDTSRLAHEAGLANLYHHQRLYDRRDAGFLRSLAGRR